MAIFKDLKTLISTQPQPPPNDAPNPAIAAKKVLVVEDDNYIREIYVELMKKQGYIVSEAVNGQEGLAKVQSEKPNLILLDIMMPVMDGKTMLHELRQIPEFKTLPVIVLTNAGDVDTMRQTKMYDNASAFLIKSNINPDEIINHVKSLI